MSITRRQAIAAAAGAYPALQFAQNIDQGKYRATRDSLKAYRVPEWFQDAKFGIWAHWGPQSAPEDGDWYARQMYIQGNPQYRFHVAHYGHPSKVGFKDVIATFKAEKWDPEHLMDLYKKAGAKYFVSMGVHHDNFDMWNSKFQPRWNAAASGPKTDIVARWKDAARKRGLYFGVSEHLSNSFDWLATSHTSDKEGPLAGVPYDGANPAYADLYHNYDGMPADFAQKAAAMGRVAPERWKREYFNRIEDLIDQHQPDLLYTDGGIPFDNYGLGLVASLYNVNPKAVYTSKTKSDCAEGTCALDMERGIVDRISPVPWQTDTCIGAWHYKKDIRYKTPKMVIDMFADIVSRNGNLLLNFPLPGSGELDPEELRILAAITDWMAVNSEAIYSSRPWKVYGIGPSTIPVPVQPNRPRFNENGRKALTAEDVRFTTKGGYLYALVMGWPEKEAVIAADTGKVHNVELLGHNGKLKWTQDAKAIRIELPESKPCDYAVTFKLALT